MAMRSQVFEWDLFRGTQATGGVNTGILNTTSSPIKSLIVYANSPGPTYPTYLAGSTYTTGFLDVNDIDIDTYSAASVEATAVDGANRNITTITIDDRGDGYKEDAIIYVIGELPPIANGLYQQWRVDEIYNGGFGYSTGAATTTAKTGSGSGMTITVDTVTADGEITAFTITNGGSGYVIGDTVTVDGVSTGKATIEITDVNYTQGGRFVDLGKPFSVMTEKGNRLKNQPSTKATQFLVVEAFGCSSTVLSPGSAAFRDIPVNQGSTYRGKTFTTRSVAGPRAYLQFYINTTGYFKDPDGVPRDGIPGTAAPYPLSLQFTACKKRKQPPVYILPGQSWDLKMTCYENWLGLNDTDVEATAEGQVQCFFKYILYDGPDAIIAIKLLENGIKITPENVDEFKRNLFENTLNNPPQA